MTARKMRWRALGSRGPRALAGQLRWYDPAIFALAWFAIPAPRMLLESIVPQVASLGLPIPALIELVSLLLATVLGLWLCFAIVTKLFVVPGGVTRHVLCPACLRCRYDLAWIEPEDELIRCPECGTPNPSTADQFFSDGPRWLRRFQLERTQRIIEANQPTAA